MKSSENGFTQWNNIYRIGAAAALGAVLVGVIEIAINFLPGGNTTQNTALDWFRLYQENTFMGLRDMGLLNIILNSLSILFYFALYAAFRQDRNHPFAALTVLIAFLGLSIFFANNRAFPMLELSKQYAAATTEAQRAVLVAAGQSMLSVGKSHSPGTFLGFFFAEAAGIIISTLMLRSTVFSKATAFAGILGFGFLLIFEFFASFVTGLSTAAVILAMVGGLSSMTWYILIARRLFQLSQNLAKKS
jgi:hypothetical protein